MNVEIDRDENVDIDNRACHIVQLTREWIKKPFKLDPIPLLVPLQGITRPIKGKGVKITVPNFQAQAPVRLDTVHRHEWEIEYFEVDRGVKRKRVTKGSKQTTHTQPPQQPQQGPEQAEPQDEQATQVQETEQVPPLGKEHEPEQEEEQRVPPTGQEEEASPLIPKKARVESTVGGSRRRKLKNKDTPPYVPKTILEAEV